MGKKSKKSTSDVIDTPKAPWLYINDHRTVHTEHLHNHFFESSAIVHNFPETKATQPLADVLLANLTNDREIFIIADDYSDASENLTKKLETANAVREAAIKHGCNFVSINIYENEGMATKKEDLAKWGTNHLEIRSFGDDMKSVEETAEKIYRWLFKALTPHETLHIIHKSEMLKIDNKNFPDYAYCSIAKSRDAPKDAKIQFVAIVLTRPVVSADQKITWSVADRSGVANFYFQYRGTNSQYTWDWALALKPGDRKALPRMPMVEIKERKRVKIAKAPLRGIGLAITGVGMGVRAIGHGVAKVGNVCKMGPSSRWVHQGDVVNGNVVHWGKRFDEEKKTLAENKTSNLRIERGDVKNSRAAAAAEVKVFSEKGEKLWKDDDSVASTEHDGEGLVNEKEFL